MNKYIFLIVMFLTPLGAVGEAGAIFLLIAPGAAAASTGEAQVAKADDSYASYYNPAGLAFQSSFGVAGMHVNWLPNLADDLYYEFLSFKQPKASGTFGGHLIYLNLGDQMGTDELGNETGVFKSYMWAATASYGTKITNKSSIGINFKVFHQKLADSGTGSEGGDPYSTDFAFDIGYLKKFNQKRALQASNGYNLDINDGQDQDFGRIFRELSSVYNMQTLLNDKLRLIEINAQNVPEFDNNINMENISGVSNDSLVAQITALTVEKELLENSLSNISVESDSLSIQIESKNSFLSNLYLIEPLEDVMDIKESIEYHSEDKKYFGDHEFLQQNNIFSNLGGNLVSGIFALDYLSDSDKYKTETEGELDQIIMSFTSKTVDNVKSEVEIMSSQNDIALDEAKSTLKTYKKLSSYVRSSTFPILNGEIKRQIKGWDIIVKKRTEIKSYFEDIDEQINYNDISSSDVLFFIANSHLLANDTTDWSFTENMTKEKKKLTNKQYAYFSDLTQLIGIDSILSSDGSTAFSSVPFYGMGLWNGTDKIAETLVKNPDYIDWLSQIELAQTALSNLSDLYTQINLEKDTQTAQIADIESELNATEKALEDENKKVAKLKVLTAPSNISEYSVLIDEQFEILTQLRDLLTKFSNNSALASYYNTNNTLIDLSESIESLMTGINIEHLSSEFLRDASNVATNLENLISSQNEFINIYSQSESSVKDDSSTTNNQTKEKGDFNLGFTISNIGPEIDFVDADQADPSPTNLRFGIYKEFIINRHNKINLLVDINRLMVAKYAAMDIDGDGIIDINTNEEGYSDPWYKAIVTCWLDDWYYDYDRDLDDDDIIGGRFQIDGQYMAFTSENQEFTNPEATNPGYETSQFSGATGAWWSSVGCPGGLCNQTSTYYYNGYNFTEVDFLDAADEFMDDNGDGLWNPPEPFYDVGDGIFSEFSGYSDDLSDYQYIINNGEYWIYYNTFDSQSAIVKVEVAQTGDDITTITGIDWGNGSREITEGYVDWDGDGNYDHGEVWTEDVNENGTYNTSYSALNKDGTQEVGSGDNYTIKDELKELIANIGMEYWYTDNFAIRAGYIYDKEGNIMNPTFGAGIRFGQYGFDFGYTAGATDHARANTMFFSISMGL